MSGQSLCVRERKKPKVGFSIDSIMKSKTPPLSGSSSSSPDRGDVTSGRCDVIHGSRPPRSMNEPLSQHEKEVNLSRISSRRAEEARRVRGRSPRQPQDERISPAAPPYSHNSNYIPDPSFNPVLHSEQYLDHLYRMNSARVPGLPEFPGAGYGLYSTSGLQEAAALHNRLVQYPYLLPQSHQHLSHFTWLLSRQSSSCPSPVFDDTTLLFSGCRKSKRVRTAFSPSQLLKLENAFEKNHYVVGSERKELAKNLNLTETQVKVWFQNRRTKHKRVQGDDCLDSQLETTSTTPTTTPMTEASIQSNCESWDVEKANYIRPKRDVANIPNDTA